MNPDEIAAVLCTRIDQDMIERSARHVAAELGISEAEVWRRVRASFEAERGAA